ncbi:hypothetical protein J7T55_009858 [Diaporthe amygdali]|uniref:uncharacterized protein n=1 Tax=Phomopsis amygdali TaxID=1214568 RepID=UPI0022FF28F1|nr:uncharacterized protein J7T55_009858 [Diaporthe amygdali]KAJ0116708.1 hypothetical protein J7T55_009858 [Diaporthe amygdali]
MSRDREIQQVGTLSSFPAEQRPSVGPASPNGLHGFLAKERRKTASGATDRDAIRVAKTSDAHIGYFKNRSALGEDPEKRVKLRERAITFVMICSSEDLLRGLIRLHDDTLNHTRTEFLLQRLLQILSFKLASFSSIMFGLEVVNPCNGTMTPHLSVSGGAPQWITGQGSKPPSGLWLPGYCR